MTELNAALCLNIRKSENISFPDWKRTHNGRVHSQKITPLRHDGLGIY